MPNPHIIMRGAVPDYKATSVQLAYQLQLVKANCDQFRIGMNEALRDLDDVRTYLRQISRHWTFRFLPSFLKARIERLV